MLSNIESHAKVEYLEGDICFRLNRFDDALGKYQKAEAIWPDCANAHYGLANTFGPLNRLDAAIAEYQKTLEIEPDYVMAHNNLGNAFMLEGRTGKAIQQWKLALQYKPDLIFAQVDLAWVLATCPDPSLRDGPTAIALAQRATKFSGGKDPIALRSLAAAYAENGQYPDAIAAAQQAIQIARSNPGLAANIQTQLKVYQSNQPFRDQTLGAAKN